MHLGRGGERGFHAHQTGGFFGRQVHENAGGFLALTGGADPGVAHLYLGMGSHCKQHQKSREESFQHGVSFKVRCVQ